MERHPTPHLYLRSLDPDSQDSLTRIAHWVRPASVVLDIGCGPGILGRYLVERLGCQVDGVEYNPAAVRLAAPWYRHLAIADLEQAYLPELFPGAHYDYIICADILEHLRNPERILVQAATLLATHGRLLLSIPNIAYAGLIAELLTGEFCYRPEGLLDETHLRFFTRQSLERWLIAHDFAICRQDSVTLDLASSEFHDRLDRLPPLLQETLLAQPDALTYQLLVEARVASDASEMTSRASALLVDIIIPVYCGRAETQACLSSVLRSRLSVPHEIIVIDDASPEPALTDYLRELATAGHITLLCNEQNLGFVQTVNRGMVLHEERDIVLLNSDTEVAGDWLDRLRTCAYSDPDIGTVTPFSNNATICSYPQTCSDNALPLGYTVETLDVLFQRVNAGQSTPIPTAVGFCMYIRRDCLRAVGLFDATHFSRGYGEENDFCMRAIAAGWSHRLCGDVFVYHRGGVSFGDQRHLLEQAGIVTLHRLYPNYDSAIQAHIAADPAKPLRQAVDAARLLNSNLPIVLFISHLQGGGTVKHAEELAVLFNNQMQTLLFGPVVGKRHALYWVRNGENFKLHFDLPEDYKLLCEVLRALGVNWIHFHHLIRSDTSVWQLPQELGIPYDYTLHDYYPICPRINLFNSIDRYCGQPDEAQCNRCLQTIEPVINNTTIQYWRIRHMQILNAAHPGFTPTLDVKKRVLRYLPAANLILRHILK
ncbi:MAG: methyltransferase domain-containing protein [Candidatus Competibacteraceae bacterium]|nr:methyltransferase domain-containing protein [Candidatus Competibacteraceae bacterium]